MTASNALSEYENNVHSQFGEDGILAEIFNRLGVSQSGEPKWCVEFGAWDGIYLSNTYNLIANSDWRAVLIEGDRRRYDDLCRNIPSDAVTKICRFVGFEGADSLDAILSKTEIPADFDLLSIDIDGCDYHIWESLQTYKPKVVCIEYNPTIPVDVPFVQAKDFNVKHGNGVKALDNLAHEKGYRTVALTTTNVIAVREDLTDKVLPKGIPAIEDIAPESARQFIFRGYDGTILSNRDALPTGWHGLRMSVDDIQVIPRYLRTYPHDYSRGQSFLFRFFRIWHKARRLIQGRKI